MIGGVGILNVGAGDTKLSFDPSNPAECIRAARVVKDMIRRGYALLVEVDMGDGKKKFTRALDFDENVCEYIIADFDPVTAAAADARDRNNNGEQHGKQDSQTQASDTQANPTPRTKPHTRRVKAGDTRSVAVAPSAGG